MNRSMRDALLARLQTLTRLEAELEAEINETRRLVASWPPDRPRPKPETKH